MVVVQVKPRNSIFGFGIVYLAAWLLRAPYLVLVLVEMSIIPVLPLKIDVLSSIYKPQIIVI